MNVFVLQSFVAVLTIIQNCIYCIYLTPNVYLNFLPAFELFTDWNIAEAVSVIPWDLKEAYYCVNVQ